jgi:hypothetical protein
MTTSLSAQPVVTPRIGWHLVNGRWLRASGSCDWPELVSISAGHDSIDAEVKLSERAMSLLKSGRMAALEIGAARDLYNVTIGDLRPPRERLGAGEGATGKTLTLRELADAARPEAVEHSPLRPVMLLVRPGAFRIVARGQLRGTPMIITFMCGDVRAGRRGGGGAGAGGRAQLSVNVINDPASRLNCAFQADSFRELIDQHPTELRKYLSPILRRLGSSDPFAPGATDVYGAFPELDPDPVMREKFAAVLPRLSDMDPRQRQRAYDDLKALGPAAACVALRWPEQDLDPQQQQLVRQYLRSQSHRRDATYEELRRDPLFLLDCLELDDPQVRALAQAELERVLSRTIDLDPTRSDACATLAAKLREELLNKKG